MAMFAKSLVFIAVFAGMAAVSFAQANNSQMAQLANAAVQAEKQGDFSLAVRNYRKLAGWLPGNAEIQSNLGVALYFNGKMQESITAFQKSISLNPHLLAPHLFSGLAWYKLSNPDRAVPQLQEAVRIAPSNTIAHTWLGYAYRDQNQNKKALQEFEAVAGLQPDDPNAWYELGQIWLQIGKDDTRKLFSIAPNGGRAWELAGEQCLALGQRENALKDFEQAEKRRPDIAELRTFIAKLGGTVAPAASEQQSAHSVEDALYEEAHKAEKESQAAYERVFQLAPNSYRAHEVMANIYEAKQHYGKAVSEYRTVLTLKPNLRNIHELLGEALVEDGKLPAALQEFQAEVRLQPRSALANMNVGHVLVMMGNDAAAAKSLNAALKMDLPPPETHFLLGKIAFRHKQYRDAITQLQKYVASVKGNPSAYYLLAMSFRNLGDTVQMKKYLTLYRNSQSLTAHNQSLQEMGAVRSDEAQ